MEQIPRGSSEGKKKSTGFQDTSKKVCERDSRIAGDGAGWTRLFPVTCHTLVSMMKRRRVIQTSFNWLEMSYQLGKIPVL